MTGTFTQIAGGGAMAILAGITAALTTTPTEAATRVIEEATIYVESDFSTRIDKVAIRRVQREGGHPWWEYRSPGGHWDRCFETCHEAYRINVLDFWEDNIGQGGNDYN